MRKIFLSIILWLFFTNVYAESFYTNYTLVSENNMEYDEEYNGDELKKIERKDGYNNYKEVRSSESYFEQGMEPTNFTNCDLNDYIIKDYYAKIPFIDNDYEYSTLLIREYTKSRFIVLRSFIGNSVLKNIEITYNGDLINYKIHQSNYNFKSALNTKSEIVIDLGTKYNLDGLELKLNFEDENLKSIGFMLDIYNSNSYYSTNPYIYYTNEFYRSGKNENYIINFLSKDKFRKLLKKLSWVKYRNYDTLTSVSYYHKLVKLYKYYMLEKEYLDIYTIEPLEGYQLDYNDKVNLYDYYKRDFIEVKDEIENKETIDDLIVSSSLTKDKINLEIKDISAEEILVVIKVEGNTFFKKIKVNNKTNDETTEEKSNEEIIDNKDNKEIKIDLNENPIEKNNINDGLGSEINPNNIQINDNNVSNQLSKSNELVIDNNISNDETISFIEEEEIVIEKDFSPNDEIFVYEEITKEEVNNEPKEDDTIALLTSNEDKSERIINKKSKFNIKILLIILIICVKFLTLYKKKKSTFVEDV